MDIYHLFNIQFGTHLYKDRFLFSMTNMNFPLQPVDNDKEKIVHNKLILYNSNHKNKNNNNLITNKELYHRALDNKVNDENNPNNSKFISGSKEIINKQNKVILIKNEKKDNINDENINNENIGEKNKNININKNELLGKKRKLENKIKIENFDETEKTEEKTKKVEINKNVKEKEILKLNTNKTNKKSELSVIEKMNNNNKNIVKEKINNIQHKKIESSNKIKKDPLQSDNIEKEIESNNNKNNSKENNISKTNNSLSNDLLKKIKAKSVTKVMIKKEKDNSFNNSINNENVNNNNQTETNNDEEDEELKEFEKDLRDYLRRTISEERKYIFFGNIIPESLHVILNLFKKNYKIIADKQFPLYRNKKVEISLYVEKGGKIKTLINNI